MRVVSLILALLIDAAAAWFWLRWLKARDVYSVKKGQRRAVPVFFVFGLLAAPFSFLLYELNPYDPLAWSWTSYYFLVNAPSEELAKFLVFLCVAKASRSVKDPLDAAVQGASTGLGFAVAENVLYAFSVTPLQMLVRSLVALAGHGAWTAVSAFSWGAADYYLGRERRRGAWGYTSLGLCLAAAGHACYNSLGELGRGSLVLMLGLAGLYFALLSAALSDGRRLSPYYGFPLEDWAKAVVHLDYGLDRDPGNWVLFQRRGLYLLRGGYLKDAAEDFQAAMERGGGAWPRAWLAAALRLEGLAEGGELEAALGALEAGALAAFLSVLRRVASGLPGGKELVREVAALLPPPPPEPEPPPSWLARPGGMDRRPEAVARARALREKGRAERRTVRAPVARRLPRRGSAPSDPWAFAGRGTPPAALARAPGTAAATAGGASGPGRAAAGPGSRAPAFRTAKEQVFERLLRERNESRLMV